MRILFVTGAILALTITKVTMKENPKVDSGKSTTKDKKPPQNISASSNDKDNPIKTITFEGSKNNTICKVLYNRKVDGNIILYRSTKPDDKNSYTISHMLSKSDIKSEGGLVKKFKLPTLSEDERKYSYCVAVCDNSGEKEKTHYSEPFTFCESQNKFMLSREAKNHKSTTSAAWIALGLAIAALVLILLVIIYKFFC
ncbi:hypothetical protein H312_02244 [Anncaliia algerae PRA339]|uniref:Uncharacterized protein n=1 Tax=Anncaliia algerae PRA339 TaxID=1288291 RepID=A0A059EZP6_9MICR|nr:hypothetical protein H312_02244 [Anncaliia algerae PRA339]